MILFQFLSRLSPEFSTSREERRNQPCFLSVIRKGKNQNLASRPIWRTFGWPWSSPGEREFAYQRRVLIKVAIANPPWPDHKVNNSRPAQARGSVRPRLEIHFLAALQCCAGEFLSFAFVLHSLLARPANDERASGPRNEVLIF